MPFGRGQGPSATYGICRAAARVALLALFAFRARGQAGVPREGGVILAANHASFLDPIAVGCALPRPVHYLARESLFDVPGLRALLPKLNVTPIRRGAGDVRALRTALELLRGGAAVLVFPEGTRSRDGRFGPLRAGAGLLAARSGAPVVPTVIAGSFQAWPRTRTFPRPAPVTVWFEPIIRASSDPADVTRRIAEAWSRRRGALAARKCEGDETCLTRN